jgi:allantoate deiminase
MAEIDGICARRGLSVRVEHTHTAQTVHCDQAAKSALAAAIVATGDRDPLELFSAPGHDAMAIASLAPVGMLFVRCAGGVSHHPEESVLESDVALAIDALHTAVRDLAAQYATRSPWT